jgi:hypothetical protein
MAHATPVAPRMPNISETDGSVAQLSRHFVRNIC